jgi:predicted RND superfamily exporter protein
MPNLFERRDPWGNSPAIWILALMAFLVPFGWRSLRQIRQDNDVEHWLPSNNPELRVLKEAQRLFPSDEWIFVGWEGSSLGDPRVAEFARRLQGVTDAEGVRRNGLPHVSGVVQPADLLLTMQRGNVEPQEAARRLQGVLLGAGPMKVRLTEAGRERMRKSKEHLGQAVRKAFGIQLEILPPMAHVAAHASIPQPSEDDDQALAAERAAPAVMSAEGQLIARETLDHDLQLSWNGIAPGTAATTDIAVLLREVRLDDPQGSSEGMSLVEDCFFVLGSPIALAVSLSEAGVADKSQTLESIRAAAASVGIPSDTLHMGGSVVAGNELNLKVTESAWNPAAPWTQLHHRSVLLLSCLVGGGLALLMVRSLRLAILILLASIYATFIAVALVPATGGSMNMVLAVLPTLLMVITISGSIHVANYWMHAAAEDPRQAIAKTSRTAAAPCAMASVTTAIGLISLCTSSLTPVRDFGVYGAIGVLLSLAVILYGLPSLLQIWPGKPPRMEELDHRGWRALGRFLVQRPGLQAVGFLAVSAALSAGLWYFHTETKVIRYFPSSSNIVKDYRFLENNVAGIVPVLVLVKFDEAAQDQTTFLDRMELVRGVEEKLRSQAEISGCLSLADFRAITEKPGPDAGMLTTSRYHKQASLMQQRMRDGEIAGSENFYVQIPKPDSPAAETREPGQLAQPGDEVWRITAQAMVMPETEDADVLAEVDRCAREVLRYQPGAEHVITGAVPLFMQAQEAVLQSLIRSFGLAFLLVLGVFVVFLRNFWGALVAMIPNIIPITIVFGILGWCGERIDIGVMITASIALGIAVDGTLHFLTWFREGMLIGLSRREAIVRALVHCGPAMWQTSAAVAFGLLMLLPAELLLISRFGWLMAAMVGVALLGDIILLPQLLASSAGQLLIPPPQRSRRPSPVDVAEPSPPAPHLEHAELVRSLKIQPQ